MERGELSPERLGRELQISNMTLRRLLKRDDLETIPDKYLAQLDRHTGALRKGGPAVMQASPDLEPFLEDLEAKGRECDDLDSLKRDLETKLQEPRIGQTLRDHALKLIGAITGAAGGRVPASHRMLAIGALLYLINPMDLISDALPGVGYLDDLAVLSVVSGIVTATTPGRRKASES
jgi:uncharacterized membrane protein YkvA (DUF1232 family)